MPIPGSDLSRCRCGAAFKYIGHGKRLCASCMTKYRERRGRDREAPKCRCGNVLGLRRVAENVTQCGQCDARVLDRRREDALRRFGDRLIDKGY